MRRRLGQHITRALDAAEQGWMTLPPALDDAVAALARAEQHQADAHATPIPAPGREAAHAARAAAVDDTVQAIRVGAPLPAVDPILDVDRAARAATEHRHVLAAAVEHLTGHAARAFDPTVVLTDHVRPAVLAVVAEARTLTERGETASERFAELAAGYQQLRTTATPLTGNPVYDHDGVFAEWTDPPTDERLYGRHRWFGRNMLNGWRPDPTAPAERLAWIIRTGLDIWVPTAAERDQQWIKAFR